MLYQRISISKNTAAVAMLLLKFKVTWSVSLIHCSAALWRARKPNWLPLSRSLTSMCLWTIFSMTFSKSFPVVDKRLIRYKFLGNFGCLQRFGKVIIFVSFQDFGKCDNRRQWLNKCVKCRSGLLRRCLRHSFGIPSISQAFLSSSDFINFCISQDIIFSNRVSSTASSCAYTLASTRRLKFTSHKSCGVNWFSK
jgi:hypothetical protein